MGMKGMVKYEEGMDDEGSKYKWDKWRVGHVECM